ncbi:2-keto-4-pentenoate hydratase [Salicibibacter kimchii]|uniref:2-keto-4-pentenoate hydratase n=1 Tax=Salicibibacter kimchii TaxID=2099786 RepID=A0A345C1Y1_9BACI|nr:2-keto-4-pentenoate hydratase [Salicibibacter kimchii]AXF57212.1 2-keto-4-pentenoate hydratase [Salicibibacter kimchii]
MDIQVEADRLLKAEKNKQSIEPLTDTFPEITVDEAYNIQLKQIQEKVSKGAAVVGKKIGLTSKAMQDMVQVSEPDYGHLLDNMIHLDGEDLSLDPFSEPKLEFEIAFVLKNDLQGPGVTVLDVIESTNYVAPAFEVIDSRIKDWNIRFEDTVADNGSSARAIIGGNPTAIDDVDLTHLGMVVYRNGKYLDSATGAAVMGNPVKAVAWLANALGKYEISLQNGDIVLSGALTAAIPIEDGDTFTADFAHIGSVSSSFYREGNVK